MSQSRRAELKREHALNPPPMGVYAIRNLVTGRLFLDCSNNLTGAINRHRFDLKMGTHRNAALAADWKQFGEASFIFEIIDTVTRSNDPAFDAKTELKTLFDMHLEACPRASSNSYL